MSIGLARAQLWCYRMAAASLRACGWPGLVGLALLVGAGIDIGRAVISSEPVDTLPEVGAVSSHRAASAPAPAMAVLAEADLTNLQRALAARAAAAGLGWPTADYRLLPASEALPPAYEVHCALKGNYPAIRRFLVDTLTGSPPAALREFALTRATADNAEVEAHLTFAFFLDPGATLVIAPPTVPGAASEARP
jgi:hypothetical protein